MARPNRKSGEKTRRPARLKNSARAARLFSRLPARFSTCETCGGFISSSEVRPKYDPRRQTAFELANPHLERGWSRTKPTLGNMMLNRASPRRSPHSNSATQIWTGLYEEQAKLPAEKIQWYTATPELNAREKGNRSKRPVLTLQTRRLEERAVLLNLMQRVNTAHRLEANWQAQHGNADGGRFRDAQGSTDTLVCQTLAPEYSWTDPGRATLYIVSASTVRTTTEYPTGTMEGQDIPCECIN